MAAPESLSLSPKTPFLSLNLADGVEPGLPAFEPAFLEFLTRPHTPCPRQDGHQWSWELHITRDTGTKSLSASCPHFNEVVSTSNLFAHGAAVEPGLCTAIYQPYKVCHRQAREDMDHVVTLAALRVGLNSSAYIKCANILPPASGKVRDVQMYISKVIGGLEIKLIPGLDFTLSLYKSARYLRSLQGVIIPRLLGVHNTDSGIAFNMETPHPVFWFEAGAMMPAVLKAKVVSAYSDLHARGVLHGDVALRHILVGGDTRVTIIDFQESRALVGDDAVGLGSATGADLAVEMRRVRYMLDFEDARTYETSKTRREAGRRKRNKEIVRDLERRRRAGLPFDDLKPIPSSPDDIAAPPIHPEELHEWKRSCDVTSRRVVMPGISDASLCAAVSDFVRSVMHLLDDDACWSLSSESRASRAFASPSLPSLAHDSPDPAPVDSVLHCHTDVPGVATSPAAVGLHGPLNDQTVSSESGEDDVVATMCPGSPANVARLDATTTENPTYSSAEPSGCETSVISAIVRSSVFSSPKKRARDPSDDHILELDASPSKRLRRAEYSNITSRTAQSAIAIGNESSSK